MHKGRLAKGLAASFYNDFKIHLVVYLAVNAMLVVIWAFTNSGFFWPIFPIAGRGIAVVIRGKPCHYILGHGDA